MNENSKSIGASPGTILVTGGTGFVGAYIIKLLIEKGYSVRAIRRSARLPAFIADGTWDKVEWMDGDILDIVSLQDAMEGVDAVIHSAAIVSFHKEHRKQMYKTNVEGTANVVNVALEKNISRFVHISSVAAIGRTAGVETVDEEKKWQVNKINTHYAISKYRGELEAWRGIAEGLNGVILNPSTVIGYGDWHSSSAAIFRNVYNGFPWYTEGINGFVDVEDLASTTIALMNSDISGERFIINGENWPFRQLFNTIANEFKKKQPHKKASPALGKIAWRSEWLRSLLTGKKPLLTPETARVAHSRTRFDNSKLKRQLPGFEFTPLPDTIKKACKNYLQAMQP